MSSLEILDFQTRGKALSKISFLPSGEPEMTEFDSAFLCGLLDKFKPHKIVEIGVAGGGTTAIVLTKLEDRTDKIEMFSCDFSKEYYRKVKVNGSYKKTGFMAEEISQESEVFHRFMLGDYFASFADEIGAGIDFVILDTVHYMPGELLDFLAILPYLSKRAVVVLHDVSYNLMASKPEALDGIATGVLFNVVSADKVWNFEHANNADVYPNIGAFIVDDNTEANIEDVFRSLMLKWWYVPSEREYKLYRDIYSKYYDKDCVKIYDAAFRCHRSIKERKFSLVQRFKMIARIFLNL